MMHAQDECISIAANIRPKTIPPYPIIVISQPTDIIHPFCHNARTWSVTTADEETRLTVVDGILETAVLVANSETASKVLINVKFQNGVTSFCFSEVLDRV
jgi:hypothetical protein